MHFSFQASWEIFFKGKFKLFGYHKDCISSVLKSTARKINALLVANEMESSYMTLVCLILLGLGRAGLLTVVQAGFRNRGLGFNNRIDIICFKAK